MSMPASFSEIEKKLWSSADELRANSNLKASKYSVPALIAGEVDVEGLEIAGVEVTGKVETKAVGV